MSKIKQELTMKKIVLSMVAISTILAAGAANAGSKPFSGNLDFNGTITDTSPSWIWSIPSDARSAAADWKAERGDGKRTGDETEWDYKDKGEIVVLTGYMENVAARGGPGLTPVVSVNGHEVKYGKEFAVDMVTSDGKGHLKAKGLAAMNGVDETSYAGVTRIRQGRDETDDESHITLRAALWRILRNHDVRIPDDTLDDGFEDMLGSSDGFNIRGACAVGLSSFALSFPTGAIQQTWSARLPMTVEYV